MKYGLNNDDVKRIQHVFTLFPEVDKVILYGSRAKGTYKSSSDIDLTLIGKEMDLTIQQNIENDLDDLLLPYKFDLSIFTQISNKELIDHILRIGKVFYTKSQP